MSEGFVTLVDHFTQPGDLAVVNAAKQSYGRRSQSYAPSRDNNIIDFMMEHKHGTPFEAYVMSFHIRCTIKEARDWFRYRWSSYNEYSTRFSSRIQDQYIPEGSAIRGQQNIGPNRREMFTITDPDLVNAIQSEFVDAHVDANRHYKNLLDFGLAQEAASYVYNLAQMTEFTWVVNLRSVCNFLSQRMDEAALLELRRKAYKVYALTEPLAPITFDRWTKYNQPDMMTGWSDDDMIWIPEEWRT